MFELKILYGEALVYVKERTLEINSEAHKQNCDTMVYVKTQIPAPPSPILKGYHSFVYNNYY